MFTVKSRNISAICDICLKFTTKMTKRCRSIRGATFTDNFEQISKNFCILFKTLLIFCEESPTLSNQHENYSSYIIYMFNPHMHEIFLQRYCMK